jgi:hypothetical protein
MFRDIFYGLIIGFFVGTLIVNLIKIAFYLMKLAINLLIAITRQLIKVINTYIIKRQSLKE